MKDLLKSKKYWVGITTGFGLSLFILGILTIIMASMGLIA